MNIGKKQAIEAKNTVVEFQAFSSQSSTPYRLKQKLNHKPEINVDSSQIEGRYAPGNNNLKFHSSIVADVPVIPEYIPSPTRAYLFNLPIGVTEKSISNALGYRSIKNVRIEYCLLGLPAYAVVDFNSEAYLNDNPPKEIEIEGRICFLQSEADKHKFPIHRRQIAIKDVGEGETPASMLVQMSKFGKVMHLNLPIEIYREQSLSEIKELYKNEPSQVTLNYYKKDGTIESELYPPVEIDEDHPDNYFQRQKLFESTLKFPENVDVYEGKAGQVSLKSKGYCIVTFSCQEEAQNCYYFLRNTHRVELVNEREEFEFDTKNYKALLRKIDNSLIHKGVNLENPYKNVHEELEEKTRFMLQDTFLEMTYYKTLGFYKDNAQTLLAEMDNRGADMHLHGLYRSYLNELKQSIGKQHVDIDPNNKEGNSYGRSFD